MDEGWIRNPKLHEFWSNLKCLSLWFGLFHFAVFSGSIRNNYVRVSRGPILSSHEKFQEIRSHLFSLNLLASCKMLGSRLFPINARAAPATNENARLTNNCEPAITGLANQRRSIAICLIKLNYYRGDCGAETAPICSPNDSGLIILKRFCKSHWFAHCEN